MRKGSMLPLLGIGAYLLYKSAQTKVSLKREVVLEGMNEKGMELNDANGRAEFEFSVTKDTTIRMTLRAELTHGYVTAELLDQDKRPVLCLTSFNPSGEFKAEQGKTYYRVIRFESAIGKYEIDMEEV